MDYVTSISTEMWLKPLEANQTLPYISTLTATQAASIDDISIFCSTDFPTQIYRRDVLYFESSSLFLVVTDNVYVDGNPTEISVAPLLGNLTINDTAITYALYPLLSYKTGGITAKTGEILTSRTAMFNQNISTSRDLEIPITGSFYNTDIAVSALLSSWAIDHKRFYVEERYNPFIAFTDEDGNTVTQGSGPGSWKGVFSLTEFSVAYSENLVEINGLLSNDSIPNQYSPLRVVDEIGDTGAQPFYCSLSVSGFYAFNVPFDGNGVIKYCPLDTTGLYDFAP